MVLLTLLPLKFNSLKPINLNDMYLPFSHINSADDFLNLLHFPLLIISLYEWLTSYLGKYWNLWLFSYQSCSVARRFIFQISALRLAVLMRGKLQFSYIHPCKCLNSSLNYTASLPSTSYRVYHYITHNIIWQCLN